MKNIYNKINKDKDKIKKAVKEHWETEPCEYRAGNQLSDEIASFNKIDEYRYKKSPYIPKFAKFAEGNGMKVLEIGLGSGSDFLNWAQNGAQLYGIDLTEKAVEIARRRLELNHLNATINTGDVESLDFKDDYFDIIYSYGVIHHTPDTNQAVKEIHRVLKPGGKTRIMIYHLSGLSWFYQWFLFGLLTGKPWKDRKEIVFYNNESLGTKIYSISEAKILFNNFSKIYIDTVVSASDVMDIQLSEKYQKRWIFRNIYRCLGFMKYFRAIIPASLGSYMLIEAEK